MFLLFRVRSVTLADRRLVELSSSDETMAQAESRRVKQQSKKNQRESAWRSEEPKDPIAMVCVFMYGVTTVI